jgi:hypothetical protein
MARAFASTSAETLATGAAWAALALAALFQLLGRRSLFSVGDLDCQPGFNLQSCVWFGDEEYAEEELGSARLRQALGVITEDGAWMERAGGGGGSVMTLAPGGC